MRSLWKILVCLGAVGVGLVSGQDVPRDVDFTSDVRPILSNQCFHCHGPDASHREADLRLDQKQAALDSGVLDDGLDSELVARITSTDPDLQMPPPDSGKTLDKDQVAILRRWVEAGAPWARHWAYVQPQQHDEPNVSSSTWNAHWIDRFMVDRWRREGVHPAPMADPVTLIRRLHLDVLGLPPTPEDVDSFVADPSSSRFEAIVDELLDSPHFGERMAMYWLDLVRYADTVGYHGDQDQNISPYRDYVIDAFNRNLGFDQFTIEQLAGDLLPDPTIDQRVATGYNRMLQTSHEGGVQPKEYLAIYQADRVRNVSGVWLGGTLGCAQCHDHKYDPYTSRDFYAMAAFFADIDEAQHFKKGTNSLPTARPPELDVLRRQEREQLATLNRRLEHLKQTGEKNDEFNKLEQEAKRLERARRRTMVTVALDTPRTVRFLPRGNWLDDSGPVMEPAVPEFMGVIRSDQRLSRLDLAKWLTDPRDGVGLLTARVMTNRLWYLFFGSGLSESLDDFGGQGKPPTHPELLDRLAIEFVESGWDIKHVVKLLVTSRVYRLSSRGSPETLERDPNNRLFARQARFRLPAESIRDVALSVGGLLVDDIGGASVKPYQPQGYYRHLNFPQRRYAHHADDRQWRRGVYIHWQRQFLHPMLKAFDAPTREECTAARPRSNTPLSSLVLLNDPTFVEAARGLAARMLEHRGTRHADVGIDHGFELVLSRKPSKTEREVLRTLIHSSETEYRDAERAERLLTVGEKVISDAEPAELAAWTAAARALLNLGEATTRR